MHISVVQRINDERCFLNMVDALYKGDTAYIRPLDKMIKAVFDPNQNQLFKNGVAIRFILTDQNKTIGHIAAFVNKNKAYGYQQPTGGIGFFECVNNQLAANMLFDAAVNWLRAQGMEAADGPINFGENDNFWGLLVEGFTPASFGMPYNPPYYRQLFEQYGFKTYYEQITNKLDLTRPFPERFWRIAERVLQKPELTFRHFSWKNHQQQIDDFIDIYNDAWQFHENFTPMKREQLQAILLKSKLFVEEQLIWFAYHNNEPIAFLVMFPDINQMIHDFNGKLGLYNTIKFFRRFKRHAFGRTRVTALGIKTVWQRMGIESCLFYQLREIIHKYSHINEMELSWVGDFNPKMRALQEALSSEFSKRHITYRLLFSPSSASSSPHSPIIPVDTKNQHKGKHA